MKACRLGRIIAGGGGSIAGAAEPIGIFVHCAARAGISAAGLMARGRYLAVRRRKRGLTAAPKRAVAWPDAAHRRRRLMSGESACAMRYSSKWHGVL